MKRDDVLEMLGNVWKKTTESRYKLLLLLMTFKKKQTPVWSLKNWELFGGSWPESPARCKAVAN